MKEAVLLVSFGTSYHEARVNSLERIAEDMQKESGLKVYQAFTSGVIIHKLAGQNIKIDSVKEAVERALADQVRILYVIPTHMIPGYEYQKLIQQLSEYEGSFERMKIADAVLACREDCGRIARLMKQILQPDEDKEYILMGHGTEADANIRYQQMNEAFEEAGMDNFRIASVEARPDLEDAVKALRLRGKSKKVVLHPFMVVAGDHARNDMAGEENGSQSFLSRLQEAGFQAGAVIKGLGEYPQFRRIYMEKLFRLREKGTIYGVGVGPGDPQDMTLKAVRIIKECDMIGIPSADAASCTAYQIALKAVPEMGSKPVLAVPIPMTTDRAVREAAYEEGTRRLKEQLVQGKRLAFLNLGDPTVYGTYLELHKRLLKEGFCSLLINGVPSFCAVASALSLPLGMGREKIHILPGFYHLEDVEECDGTRILMKSGGRLREVRQRLEQLQETKAVKAYAVSDCGMETEKICRDIRELPDTAGYFTTIIVKEAGEDRI